MGDIDGCARALDETEKVHSLDGHSHNGGRLRFDGSRLPEERGLAISSSAVPTSRKMPSPQPSPNHCPCAVAPPY
jgi:hypothetical protein